MNNDEILKFGNFVTDGGGSNGGGSRSSGSSSDDEGQVLGDSTTVPSGQVLVPA